MKILPKRPWFLAALGLLGVGSVCLAAAQPDYLSITEADIEVESKNSVKTLDLEIKPKQTFRSMANPVLSLWRIKRRGNNLLVLVSHLPIDDSSHENPKSGFHTHILDLKAPTEACKDANFEVDLVNSGKNTGFDADYKYKIEGNEASISDVPVSDLGDAGVETVYRSRSSRYWMLLKNQAIYAFM